MFSLKPEIVIELCVLPAPNENEQAMRYISLAISSAVCASVPR